MFDRRLYQRCFVSTAWLWVVTVAAGQSNQPIEIDSPPPVIVRSPDPGKRVVETVRAAVLADQRLARIAQKLAAVDPAPPDDVSTPGPVAAVKPLPVIDGLDERPASTLVDPADRKRLGVSPGLADSKGSPNKIYAADTSWVLNTLGALGVVVAVILSLRALLNRVMGRSSGSAHHSALEVLGRIRVASRHQVLLVRAGSRVLVVGEGGSGLRTLADIHDPQEVADLLAGSAAGRSGAIGRGFGQLLNGLNSDYSDELRRIDEGCDASEHRVDRARDRVSSLMARIRNLTPGAQEKLS